MAGTPVSEASDGPVLSLINKRIRALKKKLTRIHQMEEAMSQGKSINKEQQEVLKSKSSVVTIIDELEKLRLPLSSAVAEEISLAVNRQPQTDDVKSEPVLPEINDKVTDGAMEDLLNLLYFASLFDVKSQSDFTGTMYTRTHERECCLTYDTVTDDATDLLGERDLDLIAKLGGLLISRPGDTNLSHQNALQRCREHAGLWLTNSDQSIEPNVEATYAGLREKLRKIMASGYFTTTPQMKPPVEMAKAYVPMSVPDQVEDSCVQYQNKEEASSEFKDDETSDSPPEEIQKEGENREETVLVQTEEEVVGHNQGEEREEQYNSRRSYYNNQRGGGRGGGPRRGYNNSRGGGRGNGRGYQNGRNYDQAGNYYHRNYNNNRGGGSRGGGYNNHGGYSQVNGGASS